jgi:sporulation protein YlmC with PRC-barrel domain
MSEEDQGHPVHYSAVTRGTPVLSSDGVEVGKVDDVIDNYNEHILDGFVVETPKGDLVFADAPEVSRTYEGAVILSIDAAEAAELPPPEKGSPSFKPRRSGRLGRMLGGNWRRH